MRKYCANFAKEFKDTVRILKKECCSQIENKDNFAIYIKYVQKNMFGGQENGKDKTEMLRLEFTCCLCPLRIRDGEKRRL